MLLDRLECTPKKKHILYRRSFEVLKSIFMCEYLYVNVCMCLIGNLNGSVGYAAFEPLKTLKKPSHQSFYNARIHTQKSRHRRQQWCHNKMRAFFSTFTNRLDNSSIKFGWLSVVAQLFVPIFFCFERNQSLQIAFMLELGWRENICMHTKESFMCW